MNKRRLIDFLTLICFALSLGNCTDNYMDPERENSGESYRVSDVTAITEKYADLIISESSVTDILDDSFKDGESLIYISQAGVGIDPFVETETNNWYLYQYYDNESAWWGSEGEDGENEGGYNFAPVGQNELDWETIKKIGYIGNSYTFCSLYFPGDNKIRNGVERDQSTLTNLRNSNYLGAKHTTIKEKVRLRFRFYHLMTYLHVTLYVPIWSASDNSGYLDSAVDKAEALQIYPDLQVDWKGETTSDASPGLSIPVSSEKTDIRMYMHPETVETEININEYYPNGKDQDVIEKVTKYTFSVLLPPGQDISQRNFLRFYLHTPGGTEKKYLFSTSQIPGNTQLELSRGTVNELELYLPRKENNTILISASIEDWKKASSEVNVTEESK